MTYMQIMSGTSSPHNKCICKISCHSGKKCRSSSRHKIWEDRRTDRWTHTL